MVQEVRPFSPNFFTGFIGRALAAHSYPELKFRDPLSESALKKISREIGPIKTHYLAIRQNIRRAQIFDEMAKRFMARHPGGLVLNLGCGLCTRFSRLSEEIEEHQIQWIDFDYPSVIELRKRIFQPKHLQIAEDLTFSRQLIHFLGEERPKLVIAEGLMNEMVGTDRLYLFQTLKRYIQREDEFLFDSQYDGWERLRGCLGKMLNPLRRPSWAKGRERTYLEKNFSVGHGDLYSKRFPQPLRWPSLAEWEGQEILILKKIAR